MNQEELNRRIKFKICPNCGGRDYEKGPNGALYCTYCASKLPGNENESLPALDEIINKRIVDKDFEGALERSKLQIQKDPANLAYYWQAVLAEYGVIYVRDEDGRAKPTFFNIEYDASHKDRIKNSKYFKELEKHAQSAEELIDYRINVKELDGVLNKLSELVEKEQTFDVFISFKSSEQLKLANGETDIKDTADKKKAEEVYNYLTKKGYKVFYSPEVIEKNAGAQGKVYEPVILRALQTSQAMLLFGSKEEYLNSTWVENEWRRYKYYVTIGQKKPDSLIILYNQRKPVFPSALTRASIGTVQLNSIDYFNVNYISEIEKAIEPFVRNRAISTTKIVRREVRKEKREVQAQTLQGFKQDVNADLKLSRNLKYNVAADLAKPSSRKRAVKTIKTLREEHPESGMVLAYDLTVSMEGSALTDLPKLMPKAADWDNMVATVKEIISKADDEDFYKQFLGLMYETVLYTVKTNKATSLFSVIKNCRLEDCGRDIRKENLNKLRIQARAVFNSALFNDILDCLALSDEQYKDELTDFARRALAEKKFTDAFNVSQRILKLDNSLIEVINIRNLSKRKAAEWKEIFATGKAYGAESVYADIEEVVGFTTSDSAIDRYLDSVSEAVVQNLSVSVQADYNNFVDKFLGLYRNADKRRKIMEQICELALNGSCFETCNHYCEFLLSKEECPENARIYWMMTLCHFKCRDKAALMYLRERVDSCNYFINAQNCADEEFCNELAQIRSAQLEAVDKNHAYDLKQRKNKRSRKAGRIVNSLVLVAVLAVLAIGVLAYLGIAPFCTPFYNLSFSLFGSALFFYIIAGVLAVLIISCLITYGRIGKRHRYTGGAKAKSILITLLLAVIMAMPYIAYIPAVSGILPKKTYVTEDGAVISLEKTTSSPIDGSTASADALDESAGAVNYEYTISKIMLPGGVTSVTLPDEIDSVKVSALGGNAFEFCKDRVERVIFGNNISDVKALAFNNCKALKMVRFGSQTEYVDVDAFNGCGEITVYTEKDVPPSGWKFTSENIKVSLSSKYTGESVIEGDFSYYVNAADNATICKYNGNEVSVTVPSEIDGHKVVGIESYAFGNSLTTIEIPDSITFISARAFSACNNLTSAKISYRYLDVLPSGIRNLTITGSGILAYESGMYSQLTNVVLEGDFTEIGAEVFSGCSKLNSLTIPDSVTSIGEDAFYNCNGLTSVYFKGDIAQWCGISFGNAKANPLYYANDLYINNKLITELVIPDSVKSIGDYAFANYAKLNSVTISDGVTSIGKYAFYKCINLDDVTIADSVTSLGGCVFSGCSSLTSVTLPFASTEYNSDWFTETDNLEKVYCTKDGKTVSFVHFYDKGGYLLSGFTKAYVEGEGLSYKDMPTGAGETNYIFVGWYSNVYCDISNLKMEIGADSRGIVKLYSYYLKDSVTKAIASVSKSNTSTVTDTVVFNGHERMLALQKYGYTYKIGVRLASSKKNSIYLKASGGHTTTYSSKSNTSFTLTRNGKDTSYTGPSVSASIGSDWFSGDSKTAYASGLVSKNYGVETLSGDVTLTYKYTFSASLGEKGSTNYSIASVNVTADYSFTRA